MLATEETTIELGHSNLMQGPPGNAESWENRPMMQPYYWYVVGIDTLILGSSYFAAYKYTYKWNLFTKSYMSLVGLGALFALS